MGDAALKHYRLGDQPIITPVRIEHNAGIVDRGYTDWMIFVGLTFREAWEDYPDFAVANPEMFIGTNVRICSISTLIQHPLYGMRIVNWAMTERARNNTDYRAVQRVMGDLQLAKLRGGH